MSVLLCLLSDQHVPNLLAVHHFRPDRLVLVESPQMQRKGTAQHFVAALGKGRLEYADRCHVQQLASEDDLSQIRGALRGAVDRFPADEWIANLTGGTKPMSIATYEFFKDRGGKLVYTNLRHPDRIMDMSTGYTETCHHRLAIDEFVTGYGFRLQKPAQDVHEAKQRAEQPLWRDTANQLAARAAGHSVLSLDDAEREKARKKGIDLPADRFQFPSPDVRRAWLGDTHSRRLDKHEGEFLTGGWLEVFFYNLLSRHADDLMISDIALGQSICTEAGPPAVSNEIDVCFMHRHGLAMVECKSGSQEHDMSRGMDTLFKVEAVTRQFRALRVRSFLATTGDNVLDKEGKVRSALQSRADLYNCKIITRNVIAELATLELQDSPASPSRLRELLGL